MTSKNIFSKISFSKIKDVFAKNPEEKSSPSKTPDPSKKGISFGDIISDEMRQLRRRGLSRKYQPYTRDEILLDCLESDKFFQLFKAIDDISSQHNDDLSARNLSTYFKNSNKPISKQFYETFSKSENIDISSSEVLELTGSSSETPQKRQSPLFCAAMLGYYDQEEPELEHIYPGLETELGLPKELKAWMEKTLAGSVMPDAVYNEPEDYLYFLVNLDKRKFEILDKKIFDKLSEEKTDDNALLYGVSFFKQFPVTVALKERYPNLSKPYIQRAVCVLSRVPMFGRLVSHFGPLVKELFKSESSEEPRALKHLFTESEPVLKEITIDPHELQSNVNVKKLVCYLKEKTTTVWKALFLERRVLVYSAHPGACSTFIHTLLSLFPCACNFKYNSRALTFIENHYKEYGLPLQICNDKCLLLPNFGMQRVDEIATAKGFLGGTSNFLIRTLSKVGCDVLIDIDNNTVQFKNEALKKALAPSKAEKDLINGILKKVDKKVQKDIPSWARLNDALFVDKDDEDEYEGTEEWIREKFYEHLKVLLTEIEFFRYHASEHKLATTLHEYNKYLSKKVEETQGKGSIIRLSVKSDSDSDTKSTERLDSASPSPYKTTQQFFANTEEKKNEAENAEGEDKKEKSLDELQATIERQASLEEKKDSKDDVQESGSIQEENLHPDDPRVVLNKELAPIKSSAKILRDYGIEWLVEWAKTDNFKKWAHEHRELIRDRSVNNPSAKDHFWCFENGDLYYGGLANGEKNGTGQYLYRHSRLLYKGGWAKGKKSGNGTLSTMGAEDLIYEGSFKNDKKDGFGKLIQGKERYVGTFANDRYEGSGTLTDAEGNVYEGDFKDGYKWGMGKLKLANGEAYIGEMLKDTFHGQGQYVHTNGDIYFGAFNSGRRTGHGILQSACGDIFEGQFIEDEFVGRGTLKRSDGHRFEGEFNKGVLVNGKQGVIYYTDGSKYEGPISYYKAHGEGKLTKPGEKGEVVVEGRFESGKLIDEYKNESLSVIQEEKEEESEPAPAPASEAENKESPKEKEGENEKAPLEEKEDKSTPEK